MESNDKASGDGTCERCSVCDGIIQEGDGRFRMPGGTYCKTCYFKMHPVPKRSLFSVVNDENPSGTIS